VPISEDSRFRQALLELYEFSELCTIAERILRSVQLLVPGEIFALTESDPRSGEFRSQVFPENYYRVGFATMEEGDRAFQPYFHQHPVVIDFQRSGITGARRISDYLSGPAFRETALYQEFYRKMRVEDQLIHMIPTQRGRIAGVAVSRGERSFRPVHVERLNRLGAHLAQAYGNAMRATQAKQWSTVPAERVAAAMQELGLSRRQSEVLQAILSGLHNANAATQLGVSPLTVKKHLEKIYSVLKVRNRMAAARQVFEKLGLESR
jgi:DNA-binding CsgD family transcriptional regulator